MSVSSFVLGGVGGQSTVALFVTEGFGCFTTAPVSVVLGGIVKKRHSKRYEITLNGVPFVGRSVAELEAKVIRYRREHPANDRPAPKPKPVPTPVVAAPPGDDLAQSPSGPERGEIRDVIAPIVSRETPSLAELARGAESLAAQAALLAQEEAAQCELASATAKALAEEEDDMAALLAILEVAA